MNELEAEFGEEQYFKDIHAEHEAGTPCLVCGRQEYNIYFMTKQCTYCGSKYSTNGGILIGLILVAIMVILIAMV